MREEIFRQKSLDKVKSPESLDDYIQVSNPGVWLLLISVIILLAGGCVWGVFGHVDSTVKVNVHAENEKIVCYVTDEAITSVQTGMTAEFAGFEAVITAIGQEDGKVFCTLEAKESVPDGFYEGKIIISSVKPISFIFN